jgi:hypothetical protein
MDNILNSGNSITMDELLSRPTVLELESLTHADKLFFSEMLLLEIYSHRLIRNERNQIRHITIIEEAHHLLSGLSQRSGQPASIVEVIFREIREFSEGIVFLDQMPSEISKTALANTYTTIALNLKGKQDVATVSAAMLLQDNQPFALGSMEIGKAIVKLQGRIKEPFMIRVPEMKIPPTPVEDEALRQAMRPFIRLHEHVHKETSPVLLTDSELALLKDIAVSQKSGIVARYTRLHLSGRQGDKVKHSLMDLGYIEESGNLIPGTNRKLLRLTERGKAALGKLPVDESNDPETT